jgi:lipopolysaccharide transport system ATP-binding protein
MNKMAVKTRGLSKRYRIGERNSHSMFREALMHAALAPLRKFRSWSSGKQKGSDPGMIWALRDVDFEVEQGMVVGIIGRNGAGKTTLLKVLSGITEPTAGYADICGRVGSLLEVGTGFHMELTGRENIFMNGAILGMRRHEIKRKFDEIVAFSEVEEFLDTPVKRYSSGMYMRLAFSVAAHLEPEILLVDEVLAVGDAAFQKKCLGKMGTVAKEGRTVLFVSHNMIAVKSLCQRAIWLDEGQIKEDGESEHVVSNYLQSNASLQTEQAWYDVETAPGNDIVRLHRICVRGEGCLPSDLITMQTPFVIEVEFWSLVADEVLNINLHLITEEQIVAFSTSAADEPGWWTGPLPVGLFRGQCHIPGNFLNSGMYHVTLLAVKDQSRVVYRFEDLLSVEVLDLSQRSGAWYGKGSGVVSPIIEWTMEYIDSES